MKRREFLRNAAIVAATSGIGSLSPALSQEKEVVPNVTPPLEGTGEASLIDSEPVLQNYAATSMGIAFSVTDWANGYVIYGENSSA